MQGVSDLDPMHTGSPDTYQSFAPCASNARTGEPGRRKNQQMLTQDGTQPTARLVVIPWMIGPSNRLLLPRGLSGPQSGTTKLSSLRPLPNPGVKVGTCVFNVQRARTHAMPTRTRIYTGLPQTKIMKQEQWRSVPT